MSTSSTERRTKVKRSTEECNWGKYLRRIKGLPFVHKGNRPSWWAVPKRSGYPAPEMPYLRDDHNLDDAGMLPDIALGMLRRPLLSAELAGAKLVAPVLPGAGDARCRAGTRAPVWAAEHALVKAIVNLASLNRAVDQD